MIKTVLDWTERRGNWWPFTAGLLALCAVLAVLGASLWLWLPGALGLVMTAVRPVGTSLRYRRLIREKQRLERERATMTATLTILGTVFDRIERLQERFRDHSGEEDGR